MFTGIIESQGKVEEVIYEGTNATFKISSPISNELKVDQSVSHNGVCLTVIKVENETHFVTAVEETLSKSNLSALKAGKVVNLERCMVANGRFDGHIVQGHVDTTARVTDVTERDGSWLYDFEFSEEVELMVEKGSVTINGVSLTCFDIGERSFRVTIIPYTYDHTNFHSLKVGDDVNIEFDIVGKYVKKMLGK